MSRSEEIAAALETVMIDNGFKLFVSEGELYAIELPVTAKSQIHPIWALGFNYENLTVTDKNPKYE